jgi:hypothetical protein
MGIVSGLSAIKNIIGERGSYENVNDRELTRNIAKNGERTIRFVQELDESSNLYNADYGLGIVAVEYQHPDYYWLKIADSHDTDGACWPKERGWDQKINLYINVVDVESGELFYLSRSIFGGLGQQIVDSASERGSLTDGIWKISKKGEGMKTRYSLNLISLTDKPVEVNKESLIDFRKSVVNEIPYAEQETFVRDIENRMKSKAQEDGSVPPPEYDSVW